MVEATHPAINFLVLIPIKILAKILASTYDFAVDIVMLINITINKIHNIHDSIKKLFIQLALMILLQILSW